MRACVFREYGQRVEYCQAAHQSLCHMPVVLIGCITSHSLVRSWAGAVHVFRDAATAEPYAVHSDKHPFSCVLLCFSVQSCVECRACYLAQL